MDLRILAVNNGDTQILVHVDHHDPAYKWAESHAILADDQRGYFEVLELPIVETINDVTEDMRSVNTFGIGLARNLTELGFPGLICEVISQCQSEDGLLDAVSSLSPEWQEAVVDAACGTSMSFTWLADRGSSRVALIKNDRELELALTLPLQDWRLFLHPNQKSAVQHSGLRDLRIIGGPGTGKSITLLHRAVWLAHAYNDQIIVLLTHNDTLVEWLTNALSKLEPHQPFNLVIDTSVILQGIPGKKRNLKGREKVSKDTELVKKSQNVRVIRNHRDIGRLAHLLIDEAQDLDVEQYHSLFNICERRTFKLTLAYDINQSIGNARAAQLDGFKDLLLEKADTIHLTYSYRLSRENSILVNKFGLHMANSLKADKNAISRRAQKLFTYTTVPLTFGFSGPIPRVLLAEDVDALRVLCEENLLRLSEVYGLKNIALVYHREPSWLPSPNMGLRVYEFKQTKGLEFFAGIILGTELILGDGRLSLSDNNLYTYTSSPREGIKTLNASDQFRLNQLYIALSRFREQVVIIIQDHKHVSMYLQRLIQEGKI